MLISRLLSFGFLMFLGSVSAVAAGVKTESSSRLLENAWSLAPRLAAATPEREEWMDAPGCWTRKSDGASAVMGMPETVCVKRAGVKIAARQELPFGYGGGMLIEGAPFSGVFWISGAVRQSDGWIIIGGIWHGEGSPSVCGTLNKAGLVAEFRIDEQSRPVPGTLLVRGYAYNSAPQCRLPAPAIEVPYSR